MFSTLVGLIVITSQMPPQATPATYLCTECDAPLFNDGDKCDSLRGWLTFSNTINQKSIRHTKQQTLYCSDCGHLLGHLSNNGPIQNKNCYYINPSTLKIK